MYYQKSIKIENMKAIYELSHFEKDGVKYLASGSSYEKLLIFGI